MCAMTSAREKAAKIWAVRVFPEKDKLRTVDLSKISCPERLCNLLELRKNCCTRDTFHFIAALRVEGNYVKMRKINLRIFHANGKKEEERRSQRSQLR